MQGEVIVVDLDEVDDDGPNLDADDPFAVFDEWASTEDDTAYRGL